MTLKAIAALVFIIVFSFEVNARERVSVDQALNQSLEENKSVQTNVKKRRAARTKVAANPRPKAVRIDVGEAGALGGGPTNVPVSGGRDEGLAWRNPDSISQDSGSIDAEVSTVNAAKIEISPEERAEAASETAAKPAVKRSK